MRDGEPGHDPDTDVVVIGSGAFGAATAYSLMRRGGRRVALLDRHPIASQTSPHATGHAAILSSSDRMTSLPSRAVEWFLRFSADTRQPLDVVQAGSLKAAWRPDDAATLATEALDIATGCNVAGLSIVPAIGELLAQSIVAGRRRISRPCRSPASGRSGAASDGCARRRPRSTRTSARIARRKHEIPGGAGRSSIRGTAQRGRCSGVRSSW